MAILPVNSTNSDTANNTAINNAIRQLNNEQTTKIIKDDTGTRRVLIGSGANGFEGIKVSKSGKDVYTAANADLVFNSDQNVFKIVATGTITSPVISIANPGATYSSKDAFTTIAHGLGYIPVVIGYINNSGTYYQLPFYFPRGTGTAGAIAWPFLQISADSSNVNLEFSVTVFNQAWSNAAGDFSVKYYLLQETAN